MGTWITHFPVCFYAQQFHVNFISLERLEHIFHEHIFKNPLVDIMNTVHSCLLINRSRCPVRLRRWEFVNIPWQFEGLIFSDRSRSTVGMNRYLASVKIFNSSLIDGVQINLILCIESSNRAAFTHTHTHTHTLALCYWKTLWNRKLLIGSIPLLFPFMLVLKYFFFSKLWFFPPFRCKL